MRDTRIKKIMIRDTRNENFKCKNMKILNATRDTSVYLIIEHTDTSVTFRDTRHKCFVFIRSDIFREGDTSFFKLWDLNQMETG
jgi:hypothetical protein